MPPMTDEELLQIAANHVGKLDGADLSELDLITTERSELIAFGRAVEAELKKANTQTPDAIPTGPLSEAELREQWNAQADEFNQWDWLDSHEQLAWAQKCAIAAHKAARVLAPKEVETRFRAWIQQEHGLIPSPTETTYAAAFALHMLRGEVK